MCVSIYVKDGKELIAVIDERDDLRKFLADHDGHIVACDSELDDAMDDSGCLCIVDVDESIKSTGLEPGFCLKVNPITGHYVNLGTKKNKRVLMRNKQRKAQA